MRYIFAGALLAAIAGCAVTGGVVPAASSKSAFDDSMYSGETSIYNERAITGESYRIFKQGASGASSPLTIRGEIELSASDYCRAKGKELRLLRQTASTPPYLLGNFPKVELLFECVDGLANSVPVAAPTGSDKYNDLVRLKKVSTR